ncbi:uncharacterized protein LOC131955971 isoform X2 [Physella acuta]|nr:uncharacterized protein LOC131955971 isoform X2 [Physella acuta]
MHVPQDKMHLMDNAYFLTEVCGFDMDCSEYEYPWMSVCVFNKSVFAKGCSFLIREYEHDCYCDDAEPKRWYSFLYGEAFERTDFTVRFFFEADAARGYWEYRPPLTSSNSTLKVQDLIDRGDVVFNHKVSRRSTNRSTCLTSDFSLQMTSVAIIFAIVGLVT